MDRSNQLILTVDYEVFGNGSGCIQHCVLNPLDRLAALVESHGGRLEIFVDALEFAIMEAQLNFAQNVSAVRSQLTEMLKRGHQVQLHIHPQWHNARFERGRWLVDKRGWRVGDFDQAQCLLLMEIGHTWLRSIFPPNELGNSGLAFRAGGWCIQPSRAVLAALRALGYQLDSSVAPDMVNKDPIAWYDFSRAPSQPWWRVDDDVMSVGGSQFIEVPIATGRVGYARNLAGKLVRRWQGEFAGGCTGSYEARAQGERRSIEILRKVRDARISMLDYCSLTSDLMIAVALDWLRRFQDTPTPIPVVAIGHTKNFSRAAERHLDSFLAWSRTHAGIKFGSYSDWRQVAAQSLTLDTDQLRN